MSKRKKQQSWESDISNAGTYQMWYGRLQEYALSMFEWTGLPEEINKRFLELKMYEEGRIVFHKDPDYGFIVSPVMYGGAVNYYNEPTEYNAVAIGYNRRLTPDEGVIVWNNYSRTPMIPTIRAYAYRLYQVEKTMDVNINAQKTPVLLLADEAQRLTLLNTYMQYEGNEPFIFGNKSGFDKDSIQVLTTAAPFVSDKLLTYKHSLWNEAMTFLGVGNAKQDKKERLVEAEVAANDEQIMASRYSMLQARQEACEQINKMFGLNVTVDFKLNLEAAAAEEKANAAAEKESDEDGRDRD